MEEQKFLPFEPELSPMTHSNADYYLESVKIQKSLLTKVLNTSGFNYNSEKKEIKLASRTRLLVISGVLILATLAVLKFLTLALPEQAQSPVEQPTGQQFAEDQPTNVSSTVS